MVSVNSEQLPLIELRATTYRVDMEGARFVEVGLDRAKEAWAIKAGTGDAFIGMALSYEGMAALIDCYERLEEERLSKVIRSELEAEWRFVAEGESAE